LFWDRDELESIAKDGRRCSWDQVTGSKIIKSFVGNVVEVFRCGSVAEDDACVEMDGDVNIRNESEICPCLLLNCTVYLRELVFVAPFFPPNETFCPFPFDFCLLDLALLLLAPQPF